MEKQIKNLKEKAVNIKGKQYILVSDRVLFFNEQYPNGSIGTEILSEPQDEVVFVRAVVIPDVDKPLRRFTGHSQAKWGDGYINKSSALENAETSAIGRALGMMGIGVIESIASADEIHKATNDAATKTYPLKKKAFYNGVVPSERDEEIINIQSEENY